MYIHVFLLLFLFLHLSSLSPTFSLFSFIPYPSSFHLLLFLLPYYQFSKFIIFSQFERSKNFSVSFRKSTPLSIPILPNFFHLDTLFVIFAPPSPFIFATSHCPPPRASQSFSFDHPSRKPFTTLLSAGQHPPPRRFQPSAFCSRICASRRLSPGRVYDRGWKKYTGWLEWPPPPPASLQPCNYYFLRQNN